MSKLINLVGRRFNRLHVISRHGSDSRQRVLWLCQCDCGNTKVIRGSHLKDGGTQSCGCFQVDRSREALRKHGGMAGGKPTREYTIWAMMKQRCLNPRCTGYERYGGAGVKICKRWMDFANFLKDVGKSPSPDHTLDRYPNRKGNYEPKNCRWATPIQQNRNSANNRMVEFRGETKCVSEWCEILGLPYDRTLGRIHHGWTPEKAFTEPLVTVFKGRPGIGRPKRK